MENEFLDSIAPEIRKTILENSVIQEFEAGTEILREGQYVKVIPYLLSGLIKVYQQFDEKDLLLYYIEPEQSCIMSFAAGIHNQPSSIYAICEEDSKILLMPSRLVTGWIKEDPAFNDLFLKQYNIRYLDLLHTINQVLFNKMDSRLWDYLKEKKRLYNSDLIKISHRQIAADLGTAREVISRVMKKLEAENKVLQQGNSIKILE